MEKETKRPFLLAGLIINIVAFAIYCISCLLSIFTLAAAFSSYDVSNDPSLTASVVLALLVLILILAFCITGVVFSSVCIPRYKFEPEKFAKKKGMILATFIFDIIIVILSIIGFCAGNFDVLSLILVLVLIAAAVFIMLDYTKNSKLLEQTKTEKQTETTTNDSTTEDKTEEPASTTLVEEEKDKE